MTEPIATPLIVLDPGHGKYRDRDIFNGKIHGLEPIKDPGTHGYAGHEDLTEAVLNEVTAARTALALHQHKYRVMLTRPVNLANPLLNDLLATEREYLTTLNATTAASDGVLPDRFDARIELAIRNHAALYIPVHANISDDPNVHGTELFIHQKAPEHGDSQQAIEAVQAVLIARGLMVNVPGDVNRFGLLMHDGAEPVANHMRWVASVRDQHQRTLTGLAYQDLSITTPVGVPGHPDPDTGQPAGFGAVRNGLGTIPAFTYEAGFMSSPQDFAHLTSAEGGRAQADAMAEGIDRYFATRPQRATNPSGPSR